MDGSASKRKKRKKIKKLKKEKEIRERERKAAEDLEESLREARELIPQFAEEPDAGDAHALAKRIDKLLSQADRAAKETAHVGKAKEAVREVMRVFEIIEDWQHPESRGAVIALIARFGMPEDIEETKAIWEDIEAPEGVAWEEIRVSDTEEDANLGRQVDGSFTIYREDVDVEPLWKLNEEAVEGTIVRAIAERDKTWVRLAAPDLERLLALRQRSTEVLA